MIPITTTAALPLAFMEIALTTQAPTVVHVTLDTQDEIARLTLMNARHRLVDMELALIKATAIAVSVTLDILGTTVLLRSTNANLCLVFTAHAKT